MSAILPGEKMQLNIFEPRYRLMIRRAMEGNRRFGMAEVRGLESILDAKSSLIDRGEGEGG